MKKKKGFTLVELLVVIAILAILATVSVVGYLGFTKKANLSNDQTTIKMLNDNLMAEFVEEKPKTAGEAMQGLSRLNITKEKLAAYSNGYHYAYDLENMQMVLLDESDKQVYPEIKGNENLWGLYTGSSNDNVDLDQYVALTSLTDKVVVENFVNKDMTIDLNKQVFYISEELNLDYKITLKYGTYVPNYNNPNSNIETDEETIVEKEEVIEEGLLTRDYYENVVFLFDEILDNDSNLKDFTNKYALILGHDITTTTFKNCSFIETKLADKIKIFNNHAGDHPYNQFVKDKGFIIDGCTFINCDGLQTDVNNVVVKNSEFIDSYHGIFLTSPTNKAEILNNTFNVRDDALALNPNTNKGDDTKYEEYNVEFTGNTVNAKHVLYIVYPGKGYVDPNYESIKTDSISFSGNTLNNTDKFAHYDRYSGQEHGDNTETIENYLKKIVEDLNNKFQ